MARFARMDLQIRAHQAQGPRAEPFFCEPRFGALKIANRRFEVIRANRSDGMKQLLSN